MGGIKTSDLMRDGPTINTANSSDVVSLHNRGYEMRCFNLFYKQLPDD